MEQRLVRIELTQENDIKPTLQLLAENYVPAAKRFLQEADKIEAMQTDIEIMKHVLMDHSAKLEKITI